MTSHVEPHTVDPWPVRDGLVSPGDTSETCERGHSGNDAILTYNIHKGIGGRDRRYRLGRILAVIEAENPDIVCLQEVDRNVRRSRFHDQPQLLADYFGNLERIYQMNVRLREGGYGNLLLSRWPLKSHHHLSLRHEERKPRAPNWR